ncbi:Sec20-domain-containing protein [Scleroderma citrinum]
MPPLPIVFDVDSLALVETIERGLNDLSTFQLPRLRTCTGPLTTQQLWAAEIREDVDRLGKQIEELDVLVDDQRTERARRGLRLQVDTFRNTLDELRKDSRAAVLASKRAIDAQQRSHREELLSLPPTINEKASSTPGNAKTTEDALMTATNNVTETLQRTMGLMQKELERSVLSAQLLESSTATLQSASQKHDSLSNLLGSSRELITALEQTDTLDRLLIGAALVFFVLVVLFILEQRILEKSLRIAFWWTRFVSLPSWSSERSEVNIVEKGTTLGRTAIASVVSSSTVVAASATLIPTLTQVTDAATLVPIVTSAVGVTGNTMEAVSTPLLVNEMATSLPQPEGADRNDPQTIELADRVHEEL